MEYQQVEGLLFPEVITTLISFLIVTGVIVGIFFFFYRKDSGYSTSSRISHLVLTIISVILLFFIGNVVKASYDGTVQNKNLNSLNTWVETKYGLNLPQDTLTRLLISTPENPILLENQNLLILTEKNDSFKVEVKKIGDNSYTELPIRKGKP